MSRIGRTPIAIPAGVDIKVDENNFVVVTGPKGKLSYACAPQMKLVQDGNVLTVSRPDDEKQNRSFHGLTRSLIASMVEGVSEGFKKELSIQGVGYRAVKDGDKLVLNVGYSHQVVVSETEEIKIDVPNPNTVVISGIDKQKVGQFAADVRKKRPPEPYKGKGIRYANEVVHLKEGKTGAK